MRVILPAHEGKMTKLTRPWKIEIKKLINDQIWKK